MKPETPLLTLQKVLDGHEHERVKFLEELNETRRNAATLCLGVSLLFYFGLLILFAGFLAHFGFFHEIAEAASGKGGLHFANAAGAGVMAGIFLILPTIAYIVVGRSICKVTVATIKASLEKKVEEKEEHIRTQGYSTIITSCLQYVGFDSVAAMKKGPKALSITEVPNSGIELIRATGNYKTWPINFLYSQYPTILEAVSSGPRFWLKEVASKYLPEHAERLTSPVTKRTIVYQAITSTTLGTRQSASVLVKKDEGALMRTALKAKDFALDSMSTTKNIEMENSQFEKHFSVFSDDEVFARMCITPEIMHRFLEWHHLDFICEIGEQKLEFQFTFNEATDCFRLPDLAYETPSLDVLRRSVCAPLSELINILSVFEGNHLLTHP